MKIVFFSHPLFLDHQSMPRYAQWLANGMKVRGHEVNIWSPKARFVNLPLPAKFKKWLGYIDQFIVFPKWVKQQLKHDDNNTLYVFTDNALGAWVPLIKSNKKVVHCHDFLAQKSALGELAEHSTSFTGKMYQKYIRNGYRQGLNFISISKKTKQDLHKFMDSYPISLSEVVYNGLTRNFKPLNIQMCRNELGEVLHHNVTNGYLLHVGGNQWNKNRKGVVEMYTAWRTAFTSAKLPLVLIGAEPDDILWEAYNTSYFKDDILIYTKASDDLVTKAYAGATVFLFPSIAEGFGWPIVEAMASGTPVITTNAAPMTEVAGNAATLVSLYSDEPEALEQWKISSATILNNLVNLPLNERESLVKTGIENAYRFDSDSVLDQMEVVYKKIAG